MRLFLLALFLPAVSAFAQTADLTTARAVESPAARPQEVDFATAAVVALPDNWVRTRPRMIGTIWYSIPLDAALALSGRERLAVVVPRVGEKGDFWLNGERLEAGTGSTRNRTLWIELPGSALRPSGNTLEVRVAGNVDLRSGLSAIRFGRAAELRAAYEARNFLQSTLPLMLVFLVAVGVFAAIPLWLKTRRHAHLLFMALCVLWLPRAALMASPTVAFPSGGWVLLAVVLTSQLAAMLIALLGIEYLEGAGPFWRRFRRAVLVCGALSCAASIVWSIAAPLTPRGISMLHWPLSAMLVVLALAHLRAASVAPRPASVFTALALCIWAFAGVHDFAQIHDLTDFDSFFWAPSAVLLVFLALIWRTVEGLALARGRADEEVRHAVTRERQAVIAEERERLLHDLHDGMGGQLITALRMARRDEVPRTEVARVIEDSLEDMRLIIDSLDVEERDLLLLLGSLRYRLEPRLNAIGVTLQWDVEPLPELDYLTPETGLAIVRIVQEAVNNAVRHGAAKSITVCARAMPATVELSVADDGCGFDTARAAELGNPHRGLSTMRARARKLGGALSIESSAHGTRILLTLPLRRS